MILLALPLTNKLSFTYRLTSLSYHYHSCH